MLKSFVKGFLILDVSFGQRTTKIQQAVVRLYFCFLLIHLELFCMCSVAISSKVKNSGCVLFLDFVSYVL